jgi:hypothetical protein
MHKNGLIQPHHPAARRRFRAAPTITPVAFFTSEDSMSTQPEPDINPGDEAAPGTPGAGEDICPACEGSGKQANGSPCPQCGGSGRIMEGIGGG